MTGTWIGRSARTVGPARHRAPSRERRRGLAPVEIGNNGRRGYYVVAPASPLAPRTSPLVGRGLFPVFPALPPWWRASRREPALISFGLRRRCSSPRLRDASPPSAFPADRLSWGATPGVNMA